MAAASAIITPKSPNLQLPNVNYSGKFIINCNDKRILDLIFLVIISAVTVRTNAYRFGDFGKMEWWNNGLK